MKTRRELPLHLYLVTDEADKCAVGLLQTVREAVAGGVSIVQYRSTCPDHAVLVREASELHRFLRGVGVPLIINNRVELALEIGAEGAHVGQNDMPVAEARRLLGPEKILGLSVSTEEQMRAVDAEVVDYVGCGPVFPTISKKNAPKDLGIEGWVRLARLSPVPVVAIGGINVERARALRATGYCAGIAVVSAICSSAYPRSAARQLGSTRQ